MPMNLEAYRQNLLEHRVRLERSGIKPRHRTIVVNDNNLRLILKFSDELLVLGKNNRTNAGYLVTLVQMLEFIGDKQIENLTHDDLVGFYSHLKQNQLSSASMTNAVSKISNFMIWLNKGVPPECILRLKPKRNRLIKLPEDIPTETDIAKMIDVADNTEEKAMLSVLYESACRVDEFIKMSKNNLEFDEFGAKIKVSGKTGDRIIRLVNSVPLLKMWLNEHPKRDEKDFRLWVVTNKYNPCEHGKQMSYDSINRILKRLGRLAGLYDNKAGKWIRKVNPHSYRHRRLTVLSKNIPESALRRVAGWTADSNMVRTYVHYNNRDVDDILLAKIYNMKPNTTEDENSPLNLVVCNRCKNKNPNKTVYCHQCQQPLTTKAIEDVERVKEIISGLVLEVLSKGSSKEALEDAIKRMKEGQ